MIGERRTVIHCWWGQTGVAPTEVSIKVLHKLEIDLPYDPAIPSPRIYPNDSISYYRYLLIHVCCCSIYNSQEKKTIWTSIN